MADNIVDGIYSIAAYNNDLYRSDVDGASTAARANIRLYQDNDTNAQKVQVITVNGYRRLIAVCSGLYYDVSNAAQSGPGATIWQYPQNNTAAQDWTFNIVDSKVINDQTFDVYTLTSRIPSSYVMDYQGGNTANKINIWAYPANQTRAQQWVFHRDTFWDQSLPVPSNVGLSETAESEPLNNIPIRENTTLWPAWIGSSGDYQARYRYRRRSVENGVYGDWSPWTSPTGDISDYGWGDAWAPTGSDTGASQTRHADGVLFEIDTTSYDVVEVEVGVRSFRVNGSTTYGDAHGSLSSGRVLVTFLPTVTFTDATFSPDGLRISFDSNYLNDNNKMTFTLTVGGVELVADFEQNELLPDDVLFIPTSDLNFIPNDGDAIDLEGQLTVEIGDTFDVSGSPTLQYSGGHETDLTDTWTFGDGYTEIVNLGEHEMSGAWLYYNDGVRPRLFPCDLGPSGYIVIPPFGADYQVFLMIADGQTWATKMVTRRYTNTAPAYVWNFGDDYAGIAVNTNYDRDISRDYEANMTSGRDTEVVVFGTGSEYDLRVSGVTNSRLPNQQQKDFERLVLANYATFRNPWGELYRVAVLSYARSKDRKSPDEVSVMMKEIS